MNYMLFPMCAPLFTCKGNTFQPNTNTKTFPPKYPSRQPYSTQIFGYLFTCNGKLFEQITYVDVCLRTNTVAYLNKWCANIDTYLVERSAKVYLQDSACFMHSACFTVEKTNHIYFDIVKPQQLYNLQTYPFYSSNISLLLPISLTFFQFMFIYAVICIAFSRFVDIQKCPNMCICI